MELEVKNAEIFMRQNVVSLTNSEEMLDNFEVTWKTRMALLNDKSKSASYILKRFPLLMEMKEAVR